MSNDGASLYGIRYEVGLDRHMSSAKDFDGERGKQSAFGGFHGVHATVDAVEVRVGVHMPDARSGIEELLTRPGPSAGTVEHHSNGKNHRHGLSDRGSEIRISSIG